MFKTLCKTFFFLIVNSTLKQFHSLDKSKITRRSRASHTHTHTLAFHSLLSLSAFPTSTHTNTHLPIFHTHSSFTDCAIWETVDRVVLSSCWNRTVMSKSAPWHTHCHNATHSVMKTPHFPCLHTLVLLFFSHTQTQMHYCPVEVNCYLSAVEQSQPVIVSEWCCHPLSQQG